jgi:hypothetical protein
MTETPTANIDLGPKFRWLIDVTTKIRNMGYRSSDFTNAQLELLHQHMEAGTDQDEALRLMGLEPREKQP